MKVVGITGGIGMGKSTIGSLALELGIPIIDTDRIAHDLVQPGQPALLQIRDRFGSDFIDSNGMLRRQSLAERVFSDATERAALESILHPRIRGAWMNQVEVWRRAGEPCGFVIIPLLFETSAEKSFDATVCVACSDASQWDRLRARHWTEAQIRARIGSQWATSRKMHAASYVIWTEGEIAVAREQLLRILRGLRDTPRV